jgi:hypothetical protein
VADRVHHGFSATISRMIWKAWLTASIGVFNGGTVLRKNAARTNRDHRTGAAGVNTS